MTERTPNDLLSGAIGRPMLRLAAPVVGSFLLHWTYEVVDTVWVGLLPDAHVPLAALSVGAFVSWLVNAVIQLLTLGTTTLVAQALGAGDPEGARRVARHALSLALPFGLALTGAGLLALDPLLAYLGVGEAVAEQARAYLTIYFLSVPLIVWMQTFDNVQRGAGDTLRPFRINALAFGLNAALDPLLIFGLGPVPALGVEGAAIASLSARAVGVVAYAVLARRGALLVGPSDLHFEPSLETARRSARIGLPVSVLGVLFMLVYLELVRVLAPFGPEAIAAFGVVGRIEGVAYVVSDALAVATQTMVGQNLGAGQPRRALRVAWFATGLGAVVGLGMTIVMLVLPGPLAGLLAANASSETLALAAEGCRINALCQPFMAVEVILTGAFAGVGYTLPAMLNSVPNTLSRIPLAYLLAVEVGLGVTGVFWTVSLTCVLRGVIAVLWFRLPGWRRRYLYLQPRGSVAPARAGAHLDI
jgi:putative MATE family efflux protein